MLLKDSRSAPFGLLIMAGDWSLHWPRLFFLLEFLLLASTDRGQMVEDAFDQWKCSMHFPMTLTKAHAGGLVGIDFVGRNRISEGRYKRGEFREHVKNFQFRCYIQKMMTRMMMRMLLVELPAYFRRDLFF